LKSTKKARSRDAQRRTVAGPLAELVTGAAWLLGLTAALLIADGLLHQMPMARALLTGLATSVAVGRAGVVWDEQDPAGTNYARGARLAVSGFARGATASLVGVVVAVLAGWVTIGPGRPTVGTVLAIVVACATSVREELLYRALPFQFAKRAGVPMLGAVAFTALLSPSAILLSPGIKPEAVMVSLGFGFLSARILATTGSVWGAIASSFAGRIVLGPTFQTGLFSFAWQRGVVTMSPLASGPIAWIVATFAIAVGILGVPRSKPLRVPARPR
jgi:hypothetical protein